MPNSSAFMQSEITPKLFYQFIKLQYIKQVLLFVVSAVCCSYLHFDSCSKISVRSSDRRLFANSQYKRNRLAIPVVTYLVIASLHQEHVGAFGIFSKVEVFLRACNFKVVLEGDWYRRGGWRAAQSRLLCQSRPGSAQAMNELDPTMQIKFLRCHRSGHRCPSLLFDSRRIAFMFLMEKCDIYFGFMKDLPLPFSLLYLRFRVKIM